MTRQWVLWNILNQEIEIKQKKRLPAMVYCDQDTDSLETTRNVAIPFQISIRMNLFAIKPIEIRKELQIIIKQRIGKRIHSKLHLLALTHLLTYT